MQVAGAIFQRLYVLRAIDKPLGRLSDDVRKQAKKVMNDDQLVRELIPDCEPERPIAYDRRLSKVTVRVNELANGTPCRVVFQTIKNRDGMYLERTLETLSKEMPKQVFLSLSPFHEETETFRTAEDIDEALISRYTSKKSFRVGAEERLVYEKVSNLKRISIN